MRKAQGAVVARPFPQGVSHTKTLDPHPTGRLVVSGWSHNPSVRVIPGELNAKSPIARPLATRLPRLVRAGKIALDPTPPPAPTVKGRRATVGTFTFARVR